MLVRRTATAFVLVLLVGGCGDRARTAQGAPSPGAATVTPATTPGAAGARPGAPVAPVMTVVDGIPTFTWPGGSGAFTHAIFVFAADQDRPLWSWIGSAATVGYGDVEGAEGVARFVRRSGGRGAPAAPAAGWEWSWIALDPSGAIAATRGRAP